MSHPRDRVLWSALAVGAAIAAPLFTACKKESAAAPAPNVVVIRATDFAFAMPDTIPAGLTRLRLVNGGPSLHHAVIVHITQGRTFDSVVAFLHAPPGPMPSWFEMVGGPNPPAPGDSMDVISDLPAGLYAVMCFIPDSAGVPHVAHGMLHPLVVAASSAPAAAAPTSDVTLTLSDYDFTFSTPLTAGHHVIRVENSSQQGHEIFLARLDSGVTAQQLLAWEQAGMHGRPPAFPKGGVVGISPGAHSFMDLNLPAGNYGLFCFLPDAKDGKEHVLHGMVKQITIS